MSIGKQTTRSHNESKMITLDTQRQWNNAFNILRTFSLNFQPRILYLAKIFKCIDRIKEFLDTQG